MWPRIRGTKKIKKQTYGQVCAYKHTRIQKIVSLRKERDPSSTWKPSHQASCSFLRMKTVTYLPTSSTTGAGHSKKVFSTPAGFSSVCGGGESSSLQRKGWKAVRDSSERIMCGLTDCKGVIDFEAAEHLVDVSGMEEAVSTHHHLKRLW